MHIATMSETELKMRARELGKLIENSSSPGQLIIMRAERDSILEYLDVVRAPLDYRHSLTATRKPPLES